ncbi:SMC-Scp complex subunit ScpB [Rummeliibacillus sp. TYF-LIM-RU47]|uniref:SMC-Scp complex subunit ScpB n=1 Tax=Rummeliibacillus sp. TYF-LIM-RU47 TaxID=2608406 RepID=UPI00123883C0|nr:SMC-Scp complex subunit ScpB [Rummeliibacillus sp. TYF-LIM-RU47]
MSNLNLLMSKIESLLFVIGEDGLTIKQLSILLEADEGEIKLALEQMMKDYEEQDNRGIKLKELAGTFQLITKPQHAELIQKLVENPPSQSLSQASLEVLAIVAYKQPITRVEIDDLRGVKSERALHTLNARGLIHEVGRAEGTGRAILYGTSKEFLNYFGLNDLSELPTLPEEGMEELDDQPDLFMSKFQEAFQEPGTE